MKSHELFQRMSPPLATEIFSYLLQQEKPAYKAAIQGLANQRNLRAVFIERKPPAERHAWMQAALGRKISDALAAHMLQAWLMGARNEMLCDFLNALDIPHANGSLDVIPPAPGKAKIAVAVESLLAKFPAETVAIYLHAFQEMENPGGWAPLAEILNEDPRLKLAAVAA